MLNYRFFVESLNIFLFVVIIIFLFLQIIANHVSSPEVIGGSYLEIEESQAEEHQGNPALRRQ